MNALRKKCTFLRGEFLSNRQLLPSVFVIFNQKSTSATEYPPKIISKCLSFRPATNSKLEDHQRPIVLIYGWLVAKAKHISKYGDFYLGKGFDVLHIKVDPRQVLWPSKVHKTVDQIADFVTEDTRRKQPILIHGFSVGGYVYGETVLKFSSGEERFKDMATRIRGQVFDSPVDYEGVPRGIGMALSPYPIVQKSIKFALDSHLKMFPKQVLQYYKQSSGAFHKNPFRSPSLMLYSKCDLIGTPGPIETVIRSWQSQNIPTMIKYWEDTPHVSHFAFHPVEYIALLNQFLESIGFRNENEIKPATRESFPESIRARN